MSMPPPLTAHPDDDAIPAADPGAGAPASPGFGIDGEEPDVVPAGDPQPEEAAKADLPDATPFRTPDPRRIGPDGV
jgi:hypothetical protein